MKKKIEYSLECGGRKLEVLFTDLADQAGGSVMLRMGDTIVLATAVMDKNEREGLGYFPLSVDYEERFYAAGQILGSRFMRREGRPSDEAVLSGRIVDRTIRPLFDNHIRRDVQVVITILSLSEFDPDIIGVNAASLALATSSIPWNGPVGGVRIGKRKGEEEFIVSPTYLDRSSEDWEFDMVACGKDDSINMIEVAGREVPEELLVQALERARDEIKKLQTFQEKIIQEIGIQKEHLPKPEIPDTVSLLFEKEIAPRLDEALFSGAGKARIYELNKTWSTLAKEHLTDVSKAITEDYFDERINDRIHTGAIDDKKRADGRGFDEIRSLHAEAGGLSPVLHGTGIFYRGGTHVMSVLTLGGPQDSQIIDGMEIQTKKRYMHHYNFPPFSVGETGRLGGFNRRMIGHGALAEKALVPVLPNVLDFPYTIRIVSESMASNGSTSMASVCGSTLALMDAGVPIVRPVAGIASGLMMRDENNYALLTDIQGPEDEHGDMDFKVAGTRLGVTAIQMDVKVHGISVKILAEALEKARKARFEILDVIEKAIPQPRETISPNAPKIVTIKIKPDKIGLVIGSGGKTINEIRDRAGVEIEIEDDGTVFITGKAGGPEIARGIIEELTRSIVAGEKFTGTVTKIADFGAFVKITPTIEGLVHISELAPWRVEKTSELVKVGDTLPVIVKEVQDNGKISLSVKALDLQFFKKK